MDRQKLKDLARNPKFISSIFNYCDRWCERCQFTARCLNYAISKGEDNDPAANDIHNEKFWETIHSTFKETLEMVRDSAQEMGIDLNALDIQGVEKDNRQRMDKAENHELAKSARRYADMVSRWLEENKTLFREKEDELNAALRMELPGTDPENQAAGIIDAVEVIRWYQFQICVKLMRALDRDEEDETGDYPSDSDGSAKVALIGIDRSMAAWGTLRNLILAEKDPILDFLLHLDRLRRKTEQTFPKARAFLRPGFDRK
jgi:hypothetical protein